MVKTFKEYLKEKGLWFPRWLEAVFLSLGGGSKGRWEILITHNGIMQFLVILLVLITYHFIRYRMKRNGK